MAVTQKSERLGPHGGLVERCLDHLSLAAALGEAQRGENGGGQGKPGGMVALGGPRHGHDAVVAFAHGVVQA